jgi:hypothetical protein
MADAALTIFQDATPLRRGILENVHRRGSSQREEPRRKGVAS